MTLTIQDPAALLALGRELEAADYHFSTVTPATHRRVNRRRGDVPSEGLRDVFGWSRPFSAATLPASTIDLMRRAGVLDELGAELRSKVRASTLGGHLFFHSAYPTSDDDAVFFGPDTHRFVGALDGALGKIAGPPRRVVDIGCGAGPGAIILAKRFPDAEVIAADINDTALALTAVNAQLAGATNLVTCHSDLLQGLEGDFDLIISNPPYVLDADERAYRHGGGKHGSELSLAIVDAALERLRAGGSLLLYTGVAITDGADQFRDAIAPLLQTDCDMWTYDEIDPDVFGTLLNAPGYEDVERIAAVWLRAVKRWSVPRKK
ncbi:MAG TPA: class I SAM-dependent methyltransferase [Telluria sp.]|nr:class I SAM-dependent methyltransferase [Telluria sp.]